MNTNVPMDLINALLLFQSFLLVTHHKPDGDAIGSIIAFGKLLKQLEKEVVYQVETPIEDKLNIFPEIKFFNRGNSSHYDVMIYLDCSTPDFAYRSEMKIDVDQVIVIDHHRTNPRYGDINFIEETSAAGELVFRIIKALNAEPDEEMIDAVYTAISTDTGSFQFSNVTEQTHEIVSELYRYKDNFAALSRKLHHEKSFNQMKMYGEAVQSMELFENQKIAWIFLPNKIIEQYGGETNITDDISNIGMNVTDVVLAVTVKETEKDFYRLSLRSKTPYPIDVSIFANAHDGGGHMRAAGCSFEGDLNDLKQELVTFMKDQEAMYAG